MEPIINVKLGGTPVTQRVIETAKEVYMTAKGWSAAMRDDALTDGAFLLTGYISEAPAFDKAMVNLSQFENSLIWTMQINVFNALLQEYKAAEQRLARYILSEGRSEVTEEVETGKLSPDGSPHTETVVVLPGIDPLPETVDIVEVDEDGTECTVVTPNPAIEQDEAERSAAQQVIDRVPTAIEEIPCIYPGEPDKLVDYFASVK